MLSVNRYTQAYVDECRAKVNAQIAAYKKFISAARKQHAGDPASLQSAVKSFEPVFFNNMVLVLDSYFTHRSRGMEKKDGNPMDEVRVLRNSMTDNGGGTGRQ